MPSVVQHLQKADYCTMQLASLMLHTVTCACGELLRQSRNAFEVQRRLGLGMCSHMASPVQT